jgi:hypothetical protein
MKHFTIPLIFTILLSGCARETPVSNTIADNAITATTALEQSLPAECKTESITTQITVVKTQIRAIKNACETEKNVIEQEKTRWKWSFYGVLILIGLYIARKIFK